MVAKLTSTLSLAVLTLSTCTSKKKSDETLLMKASGTTLFPFHYEVRTMNNTDKKPQKVLDALERQRVLLRETKEKHMRAIAKELGFTVRRKADD